MDNKTSDESIKYVYNLLTGRIDPVNDAASLRNGAAQLHELFEALVAGGFKESQAIQIIIEYLVTMTKK